jgi:hypothetical protein
MLQHLPGDDLAGVLQQHRQELEGLALEPDADARPMQFSSL